MVRGIMAIILFTFALQKLLNACKKGDVDEALALLTYGVDVDTMCTQVCMHGLWENRPAQFAFTLSTIFSGKSDSTIGISTRGKLGHYRIATYLSCHH